MWEAAFLLPLVHVTYAIDRARGPVQCPPEIVSGVQDISASIILVVHKDACGMI